MKKRLNAFAVAVALAGTSVVVPAAVAHDAPNVAVTAGYSTASDIPFGGTIQIPFTGAVDSDTQFILPNLSNAPAWSIEVDEEGTLTVSVDDSVSPGAWLRFGVVVGTPSDGFHTHNIVVAVQEATNPVADSVALTYDETVTGERGTTLTATPRGDFPAGTTFAANTEAVNGWTFNIDENTGVITANVPADAVYGSGVNLGVTARYPDFSRSQASVTFLAEREGPTAAETITLSYPESSAISAGQTVTVHPEGGPFPAGTSFATSDEIIEGWDYGVDETTGVVSVTAPTDARDGDALTFGILAAYPDGSVGTAQTTVRVGEGEGQPYLAETTDLSYSDVTVPVNQTITADIRGAVPAGTTFAVADNVPAGWAISVNEATGAVTTSTDGVTPGSWVHIPVLVTYSDGSYEHVTIKVTTTAGEGETAYNTIYEARYSNATIAAGETTTVEQAAQLPEGTTFISPSGIPAGWVVDVDKNTGAVTVSAPADAGGAKLTVPIALVYPDGTTDVAVFEVQVTSQADEANPSYDTLTVVGGTPGTATVNDAVDNATYRLAADVEEGWTVDVDENTGDVTVIAPDNVIGEASLPVQVTYADGTVDFVYLAVRVTAVQTEQPGEPTEQPGQPTDDTPLADTLNPSYPAINLRSGETKTVAANEDLPAGTTFITPDLPSGWALTVADNGDLTITAPARYETSRLYGEIVFGYPDGSHDVVDIELRVSPDSEHHNPTYGDIEVQPGQTSTALVSGGAPGATYSIEHSVVGWNFEVDEHTGAVNVTAPAEAIPGGRAEIPVRITYADGSSDFARVNVAIVAPAEDDQETPGTPAEPPVTDRQTDAERYNPSISENVVIDGNSTTVIPIGGNLPAGTKVKTGSLPEGFSITTSPTELRITAPDTHPGTKITLSVVFSYPDGSADTEVIELTVSNTAAGISTSYPADTQVEAGQTVTVPVRNGAPGARYELSGGPARGWNLSINETTGAVTATAASTLRAPSFVQQPVRVSFADGSSTVILVKFTVTTPATQPTQPAEPADPSETQQPTPEPDVSASTVNGSTVNSTNADDASSSNDPGTIITVILAILGLLGVIGGVAVGTGLLSGFTFF